MSSSDKTLKKIWASTKTYTHSIGLSCCFRQFGAESHCHLLHGYALQISFEFRANELDSNNWVVDFGGLKDIKKWLEDNFDHKLLVALNDPMKEDLLRLQSLGLADVRIVESTGCEMFASMIFDYVDLWVYAKYGERVSLYKVEVSEHGGNSAIIYNKEAVV